MPGRELARIGIDEEAYPAAGIGEALDRFPEPRSISFQVESTFSGDLFPSLGHQGRLERSDPAGDIHDLPGGGEFEVKAPS